MNLSLRLKTLVTDFHGKHHVELSKLDKADCESRERIGPVQYRLILSFFRSPPLYRFLKSFSLDELTCFTVTFEFAMIPRMRKS